MADTRLIVEKLNPKAQLPRKANAEDACFDLFALQPETIEPGEIRALGLGLAMQLERGWEAQIRGRSGLASRGFEVHLGTIDCLYRKEVKVLVRNASKHNWEIAEGDRIAQLKLSRVWEVELIEGAVQPTDRGGLGSTGR